MGRNLISTRSGSEALKCVPDGQGQHHLGTCFKDTFLGPTLELRNQKLWQGQLSVAAACPAGDGSAWWGLGITVLETKASTTKAAICLDTVCGIRACSVVVLSESPSTASVNRRMSSLSRVWLLAFNCYSFSMFSPQGFVLWKRGPRLTMLIWEGGMIRSDIQFLQQKRSLELSQEQVHPQKRGLLERWGTSVFDPSSCGWHLPYSLGWDTARQLPPGGCCYLDLSTIRIMSQINLFILHYTALAICYSNTKWT